MRSRLVAPGVPNGVPALIRIVSPDRANPSLTAQWDAFSTISLTVVTSGVCTECTPHTNARLRAVVRLGVMLRMGGAGRSRAARRLVEPEVVYVTMSATGMTRATVFIAAQIAAALVDSADVLAALMSSR